MSTPYAIPADRLDEMADAAAEAFAAIGDPLARFIFEQEPDRPALSRLLSRMIAGECRERSIKQAPSSAIEAVAIWFPPGVDYSQDESPDPFRNILFASPETGRRLTDAFALLTTLTVMLAEEPQWYLHLLAVRPAFQGRGLASSLIRPMLERANREGRPASLITQSLANVSMYRHLGFEVLSSTPLPGSGMTFFSMRRDPEAIKSLK